MSQWNKNDAASNSVLWAAQQFKVAANTANRDALFGNTTADALITGLTIGQYGVDAAEAAATKGAVAHTGWVIKTEGSGGRAGRVFYETLVAGGIVGDAEDTAFPDWALSFTLEPSSASANATADEIATFSSAAESLPSGASITYFWQTWGGASFANLANGGAYSNVGTATLAVLANTASNGEIYRVGALASGATTIYSSNAVLTITT